MSISTPTSASTTTPSSTYATLSFHSTDIIRLLHFPPPLIAALEPIIRAGWPPGLESHGDFEPRGAAYQFKFKGRPFGHYGGDRYVGAVRLVRDVLALLHARGWEPMAAVMASRRYSAKDTLVFRKRNGGGSVGDGGGRVSQQVEWLAIAPMQSDKLRVVYDAGGGGGGGGGDGESVEGRERERDHDYLGVLIAGIKEMLEGLDYFAKGGWSNDSFEFALKGWPWRSRGDSGVKLRIMLMRLLETLEGHGWKLHTTCVLRTGTDNDRCPDTWFFVRESRRAVRPGV